MKNQYRIGNTIHCILLGESNVLEIRNDGISICNPLNKLNAYFIPNDEFRRLEPLPLTEEWLLRFGFKDDEPFSILTLNKSVSMEYYQYRRTESKFTLVNNGHVFELPHIQYVHQLQNLYFALTGQELEFAKVGE